jgi:F0F1-type ATP synthase assembly protein I
VVQQRRPDTAVAQASRYLGIGFTMALSTGLFLYLGTVADGWLGTKPWLTLVGTFVGAVAGFWYMYYHLVIEPQRTKDKGGGKQS